MLRLPADMSQFVGGLVMSKAEDGSIQHAGIESIEFESGDLKVVYGWKSILRNGQWRAVGPSELTVSIPLDHLLVFHKPDELACAFVEVGLPLHDPANNTMVFVPKGYTTNGDLLHLMNHYRQMQIMAP